MAAHVPTQPTQVFVSGGANRAFISNLNFIDRTFTNKLIEKYGAQSYTMILDAIGKKIKTDNRDFYHFESRKRHAAVQIASFTPATPTAGQAVVVTISAGSHSDSGTKSPGRLGEKYMLSATGLMGTVTAKNTSVANAHTITITPSKSTDIFQPSNSDWLLALGLHDVGEASDAQETFNPLVDKISNTTTEIREDYLITDRAAMEKIEWADPRTGITNYRYYGTSEAEKRFLNNREFLTVFGDVVTNAPMTTAGSVGTKGMLTQIVAGGSDLGYTANSLAISHFQSMTRELTFNGASSEIHMLSDVYQFQEINKLLFTTYQSGAVIWDSVGGSRDAAARYGFSSLAIDGFSFHFKKYAPFSPEWVYGVYPAATPNYRNYGVAIPQGFSNVVGQSSLPTISLRYQPCANGQEVNAYEMGGLAEMNKTAKQELRNVAIGYYGVQVAAANQCVILNG